MDAEKPIVVVVSFSTSSDDFHRVTNEAGIALENRLPAIPGFIEGMVLVNEGGTQVRVVTEWKSKEDWAAARWDETIQQTVADLLQDTASYGVEIYIQFAKSTSALSSDR